MDATLLSPTNKGGRVEPMPMALKGLCGWMSSHRPIQPEETAAVIDADCQIAIDVKCERFGSG